MFEGCYIRDQERNFPKYISFLEEKVEYGGKEMKGTCRKIGDGERTRGSLGKSDASSKDFAQHVKWFGSAK